MVKETCPAYLANPNGDVTLEKFRNEFGKLGQRAIETKQSSDGIVTFFDAETKEAKQFYRGAGVAFESFPCAQGMKVLKDQIVKEEAIVQTQFVQLTAKCSAIAQVDQEKALREMNLIAPTGKGAPDSVKKSVRKDESTISGDIEGQPAPKK